MTSTRSRASCFALAIALAASCTKLKSPDDTFVAGASDAAGGMPSGGNAGATSAGGSAGGAAASSGGSAMAAGGSSGAAGDVSAGSAGDGCLDPNGFHGLGCDRCAASDIVSLERACSDATCTPFDNAARLPLLLPDGALPTLPSGGAGGAPASASAGMTLGAASGSAGRAGGGGNAGNAGTGGAGGKSAAASAGSGAIGGSGGGATITPTGGSGGGAGVGFSCSELSARGSIVYVTGSSAAKTFLQQIAQQLASQNVFVVYTSTGSCVGLDAIVNGTPMTSGPPPAPAPSATYWDGPASGDKACDLPAAGVSADLGISDVFAPSCPGFELVNLSGLSVRDAHGPIQTMTFSVPSNSAYREISAQAAYLVFGFGKDARVLAPDATTAIWDDESLLFQRSPTSGTQAMIAAAIGLPAASFRGKANKTSDDVAAALESATADASAANKALGILAADYVDSHNLRAELRFLAYQDSRQACAVYPDSTASARDKQNVRDGHYPIWGPLHLLYKVDSAGNPANSENRQHITDIVGYLTGSKALPNGLSLIDVYAESGLVPECAMRVTRTSDGGNIVPYRPDSPCACLFDLKVTGSTTCTPCSVQGDCKPNEACSTFGYCEP